MNKLPRAFVFTILSFFALAVGAAEPPLPESEKGVIVLYRLSKAKGAAIRFNLVSTSGLTGSLTNGSWMVEQLDPGEYTYSVSSPSLDGQDSVTINLVAGQTYYIKGEIKWGWPAGRAKFTLVSESTGQTELKKLK